MVSLVFLCCSLLFPCFFLVFLLLSLLFSWFSESKVGFVGLGGLPLLLIVLGGHGHRLWI